MRKIFALAAGMLACLAHPAVACEPGLYEPADGSIKVAVAPLASGEDRYMLTDGRKGTVGATDALVRCAAGSLLLQEPGGRQDLLSEVPLRRTATTFSSLGTRLSGVLMEGVDGGTARPLVVMVHGSERTSPRGSVYPLLFLAHGLDVFIYDKRGTGLSEGEYTQNFELLAEDAAAALREAQRLSAGRHARIGFYGGSQGGWVAPLAATRAPADFVAVGFGLVASPIEEDRDQVFTELRERGYDDQVISKARDVTNATAAVMRSHFSNGFEQLADVKRRYADESWFNEIRGEFTGELLRMPEADLRRLGRARFDNVELIWDYDSRPAIRTLKVPLLWVAAEADREAPPAATLSRLQDLHAQGADITVYSFPDTDHGMWEFEEASDGQRTYTRVTDGYFRLIGDWIRGEVNGPYGRGRLRIGIGSGSDSGR